MPSIKADTPRDPAWAGMPLMWLVTKPGAQPESHIPDSTMEAIYGGKGRAMKLRSFGHDEHAVHWLSTRSGADLHTDPAYQRYTHHLIFRNDGWRLAGIDDDPTDPSSWPPPLLPGTIYCLDAHSPHSVVEDPRIPRPAEAPYYKLQAAVDRDEILSPDDAMALLLPWWTRDPVSDLGSIRSGAAPKVKA